MKSIIAAIVSFFASGVMQKIIKSIPAIVAEVEKAMLDGKITPEERKAVAMKSVDSIASNFGIGLNPFFRFAIGTLIDNLSKRLPSKDIKVPEILIGISGKF